MSQRKWTRAVGALFARNPYNTDFSDRVVFFDVDDPTRTLHRRRGDFIGRNRDLSAPAAMDFSHLSGRVGAGLDLVAPFR